jgi:hypothetical protein
MSANPPLKPWTELPEGLKDLPRKGFVRRLPATNEEFEQAKKADITFGVETFGDVMGLIDKRRGKTTKTPAK